MSLYWARLFADVPPGQARPGDAPRGTIRGPGLQKWDLSLFKNFHVGEKVGLQFRAESFNIFNHTNYSSVDTQLGSPQYGQIVGAHDPRIIQLALKLTF